MRPTDFTYRKFLALSERQQHKHLSNLLNQFFREKKNTALLKIYNQYQAWLNASPLPSTSSEDISNRFHYHLAKANKSIKEYKLLPSIRTSDRQRPISPRLPIIIYLDHIRSAHNVGSILRTIEAFQLGSVCFSDQTPTPLNKQVRDTAMGADAWVEIIEEPLHHPFIALETSPNAISIYEFIFPPSFTLILGNEEYGCSDEMLQKADHLIEIPLFGRKNSLNVANAFAITAAEIRHSNQNN